MSVEYVGDIANIGLSVFSQVACVTRPQLSRGSAPELFASDVGVARHVARTPNQRQLFPRVPPTLCFQRQSIAYKARQSPTAGRQVRQSAPICSQGCRAHARRGASGGVRLRLAELLKERLQQAESEGLDTED